MSQAADKSRAPAKPQRREKTSTGSARRHSIVLSLPAQEGVRRKKTSTGPARRPSIVISYQAKAGVDEYVRRVASATPMQIVDLERAGVHGSFIKALSKRMEIPSSRIFRILGVPKATAEAKASAGKMVAGHGGQAAIGMVKLLGIAQEIVANSTASDAEGFDAAKWLGQWIERPQPSLGGRKPADLLDTPTGVEVVARLLGSIESGAYQ